MKSVGRFFGKWWDLLLFALILYLFGVFAGFGNTSNASENNSNEKKDVSTFYAQTVKSKMEQKRIRYVTKTVVKLLHERHYRPKLQDEELSEIFFDEYLQGLDPAKIYFTKSDIEKFEPYRKKLISSAIFGNADFAFVAYDVFMQRRKEYYLFAEEMLKKPLDFTAKETFVFDRENEEYAANEEELKELWRKKIKNDVLTIKLYDRIVAEELAANAENADSKNIHALWDKKTPEEKVLSRLKDYDNFLMKQKEIDILGIYLTTLAQIYGPHSSYMSPSVGEDFDISMSLSLIGIGATLTSEDGFIRVVDIVKGGPADLDGRLKVDDRIIGVAQGDGEVVNVIDMPVSEAVKLIRGKKDTIVKLTVIPGDRGRNGKVEVYEIKRDKVNLEESAAKGVVREVTDSDGNKKKVGILTIPSFYMDFDALQKGDKNYRSLSRDVKKILNEFKEQKIESLVVDLRANGGGSLYEAIELSGLFVKNAPIVQISDRNKMLDIRRDNRSSQYYDGPMVILVNKFTASASEIFAGAMRDLNRAIVVGDTRSYGKGTVLDVVNLNELYSIFPVNFSAGELMYETAIFYRISGSSVQQLGISSDVVIPSYTECLEAGEMFNKYHLAWDEIAPCKYQLYYADLDKILPAIKSASELRIKNSKDFAEIIELSKEIIKNREVKEISLNEEERYNEYLVEKQEHEAKEKALDKKNDDAEEKDVVLDEAINIACDLLKYLK